MTLRFTIPNSGITLEAEQQQDLITQYAGLGGDRDFAISHIKRAVTAFEHGPGIATAQASLGGEVISDEPHDPDADTVVVDDPWASHPSERTTQPAKPAGRPASTQHKGDPAQYLGEDRWGNKFYRDPNAPDCLCGVQAIRKAAVGKTGKPYSAHVCFDAGPKDAGSDYRNKCDYHEFINTKKGR